MSPGRRDATSKTGVPDRLRIVQLVLSDIFAGTEGHVALLSRELISMGVEVRLICGDCNQRLIEELNDTGVEVHPLQLGKGGLPKDWAKIHRAVVGWRPHVVHTHLGGSLLCGAILTLPERRPLVFTQHFIRPAYRGARGPLSAARTLTHRLIHKRIACALATTRVARTEMVEHEGFAENRTVVVPLGIDVQQVADHAQRQPGDVREDFNLPHDAAIIVTPARLNREKGHETLLAALPAVLERCPNTYLLLAGEGAFEQTLKAQTRRLGLVARVLFLGQRADVPRLLSQSSLCVLPSYEEPFGLAILEAMAVGTPVVACEAGGPRDIVVNGQTGLLVPPHDPGMMATAIVTILVTPTRARTMGVAGQKRVHELFTSRRMAEQTLDVYHGVLSHS